MFTISDYWDSFKMVDPKVFPETERLRRVGRNELDPMLMYSTSPTGFSSSGSPKEHHPHWWQMLKGLGRRRRRSTAGSKGSDSGFDVSWHLTQVERLSEAKNKASEVITSLAYDDTGELLAAGCKNGKVVVLSRDHESPKVSHETGNDEDTSSKSRQFRQYCVFQSHEPEFDYMKTVDIDEKICKLHWLKRPNQAQFLLSANERTVKLWKLSERHFELDDNDVQTNGPTNRLASASLRIPRYKPMGRSVVSSQRRTFFAAHNFKINSLSVNSDFETFLTADDVKINLWNIGFPHESFNIVDIKPDNMEELSEVITAAEFHPESCWMFAHASTKGSVRLCDMRSQALCDRHAKLFVDEENDGFKTFFSDIIRCISDLKFSSDGRYLLTRDYLNLKVWDLQMDSSPVEVYPICQPLRTKLCTLYENDHIFDKFDCSWGCNDRYIVSGTYSNYFKIIDRTSGHHVIFESTTKSPETNNKSLWKRRSSTAMKPRPKDEINIDSLNYNKKLSHIVWNPNDNLLTNAVGSCLNFFQGKDHTWD